MKRAQLWQAFLSSSLLLLACTPQQITQNTNVQVVTNPRNSFSALGGVSLDPTVAKACAGQTVEGDQGYARSVARQYRAYAEQLISMQSGGQQGSAGSVYGVDVPQPSAEPTSTPLPSATSDISVIERTSFGGQINDSNGNPLEGVQIIARSLNSSVPFEASTSTTAGSYAFNNAPAGVQVEIVATFPGGTTRRRVEVLKSNKQGDPNANRYDFADPSLALSTLPEVVSVTPGRNASGVSADTSITLTFSEPMDTASVEAAFGLFALDENQQEVLLREAEDYYINWNSDNTEITLTQKMDRLLDESQKHYYISFKPGSSIVAQTGESRDSDFFKLTDGPFENGSSFSLAAFMTQMLALQQEYQPLPPPLKARDQFYFSYDDSASVASVELFKQALANNQLPRADWGKTWEFLNYETFDRLNQQSTGKFKVSLGLWKYPDPQNPYLDTYEIGAQVSAPYRCKDTRNALNLTLLVDVSTSMNEPAAQNGSEGGQASPAKLALVKQGLKDLYGQLRPGDLVNLVLFTNRSFVELDGFVVGREAEADYMAAVDGIKPLWGTHIEDGLDHAYRLARQHFDSTRMNRLLFLTDAHANEGQADLGRIGEMARLNNNDGIYLSALGLGHNHNHALLQAMTEAGRGAYYSIVSPTDMHEATANRFIPLIDVIARNMRFQIDFPGWLRHGKSAAEEISRDPTEVQPTNFSANTSQYFWEQFQANKTDFDSGATVKLTLSYEDPLSGTPRTEVLEQPLAQMLDQDLGNIKAAHLVQLSTALVRGEISAAEARQSLNQLLPDAGR